MVVAILKVYQLFSIRCPGTKKHTPLRRAFFGLYGLSILLFVISRWLLTSNRIDIIFTFLIYFCVAFKTVLGVEPKISFCLSLEIKQYTRHRHARATPSDFHKGVSSAAAFDTTILSVLKLHACTITIIYYQFTKNTIKLFYCLFF